MPSVSNLLTLSLLALFLLGAAELPALATDKDAKKAKTSKSAKKEGRSKKKKTRRAAPTDKRLQSQDRRCRKESGICPQGS